jgi:type II secretory pathway component PulM
LSYTVALGAGLAVLGLLLITFRPRANPLLGRVLMGLGALILAVVLWQILQQPSFLRDR